MMGEEVRRGILMEGRVEYKHKGWEGKRRKGRMEEGNAEADPIVFLGSNNSETSIDISRGQRCSWNISNGRSNKDIFTSPRHYHQCDSRW
ncbi:hypothetical protein E2C01_062588 [Portunus trituberculatus]|uniref:Uncharacterized protein n=1 Tax=Portunus trituberculatus TaxID=210409 RepID=A0A5B7HHQ4_PORTR|nr:hypothetical protein [Portunus trituberculatus]